MQVARIAAPVWQLAQHLCTHESLGQEGCVRSGVCQIAARADSAAEDRSLQSGFDLGEGAPRRDWSFKKNGPQAIGKSRGGWNTKIHLVAANARTAIIFCLSPGEAHDAPVGRQLLLELGPLPVEVPLVMDRAYESDETRQLVLELNMTPVVPPKSNRREPWDYDRQLYKKRNQVERLFRRLKGFRRIFSRFEKLDVVFLAFIYFAFIIEALR
jgi:transposase